MKIADALKIAKAEIGIKENPPNSNCVKYNDWYYNRKGISGSAYPWCCAFVCWVFRNSNGLVKKTASCSEMLKWFKQNNQFYSTPQEGDLVFYNFHTPTRLADHIGIVETVCANGSIYAIEGNTSLTSNDNGERRDGYIFNLKVNDLIIVKVGETIPVDSEVIEGEGSLDISSLTGEYVPKLVKPGDEALSGCTLKSGTLTLQVKKVYQDSTVSKILELVASSGEHKAKAENFISKFAKYYTPAVLLASLLLLVIYNKRLLV